MRRAFLAIVLVTLSGCATSPDVTAWNLAKEVNTPAAYKDFASRYPKSGHADDAREMIEKAEKDRILKASSVAECVGIVKAKPDPQTASVVGDLAFKAAQKETSVEALHDFLAHFKGHAGAPVIRKRLEELDFEQARQDPSPNALEYFLNRYPGCRFEAEALSLLQERTFRQAKEWGSQYGYKGFLARFPTGVHTLEARGWVSRAASSPPGSPPAFAQALTEESLNGPFLKKHACALALSGAIRRNVGDPDLLRRQLHDLEKAAASAALPEMCASATLKARPGSEAGLSEALRALAILDEQRKELAARYDVYRQREEIVKAAVDASGRVANELETAELSEEVLGSGPLGRLDAGQEKGSQSAKKAQERFQAVKAVIRSDQEELKRMLLETEGHYRPLLFYVTASVESK